MLPVVRARASASIQMANIFCRLQNHDYDMAINLIISDHVINQCGAWPLGRLVSCRHLFLIFFFFLRLYSVRAAIDSYTRCSYTRLHPVQQTNLQIRNFDVSVIYIMLIQQSTGIVIRGMTPALSLRCTYS